MKHFMRILCAMLVLAMMLTMLACNKSDGKNKADTTKKAETTASNNAITTDIEELGLPDTLDYEGKTVTFLATPAFRVEGQISAEELTNDAINDSIYYRNAEIEDTLNVEIVETSTGDIANLVAAGDDSVDIYASNVCDHATLIQQGYFYDLTAMENLDLDKEWWYQDWIDESMMGDRLYFLTGSLALSLYREMYAVFFNQQLVKNVYAGSSADPVADLYKVVEDGGWTMDYMTQYVSKGYTDVNGNSERDIEDVFGYGTNDYSVIDSYWSSFDMNFIDKTADGEFTLNPTTEKLYSAYDKIYQLVYNNGAYVGNGSEGYETCWKMFATGNLLMSTLRLSVIEYEEIRNMTDTYGIIPTPKYDDKQSEYYTYAHDQYTTFSIPIIAPDKECSAAVLELMSYLSYKDVVPAYFDDSLKGKYSNDMQTRRMLDTISEGLRIDAGWIYTKLFNEVCAHLVRAPIGDRLTSISSIYTKFENALKRSLPTFLEPYEKLEY